MVCYNFTTFFSYYFYNYYYWIFFHSKISSRTNIYLVQFSDKLKINQIAAQGINVYLVVIDKLSFIILGSNELKYKVRT